MLLVHNRSEALALIKQYNLFKRGVEELHCLEVIIKCNNTLHMYIGHVICLKNVITLDLKIIFVCHCGSHDFLS